MQEFLEFTLGGIAIGMIYAAIALSLVLIWRGTRVLNYSQGGMAMFTTYVAWVVIDHTGNYWLGFVLALASGLVLGAILERTVVRPTVGKSPLNSVIVTIGLLIFLEGLAGIIYGGQYRSFPAAFSVKGLKIGSVALGISPSDLFTAGAVLAAALALALVFRYTSVGLRLRATAFNPSVARLLGVRIGRVLTLGWALAGLFGALAGVLVTPSTFLYPNSMDSIFVLGFTAAVIGGLDSPVGAVIGGVLLGVVLSYAGGYIGSDLVLVYGLVVLALVLMIRPTGPVLGRRDPEGVTMTLLRHLAVAIVVAVVLAGLSIQLGGYRDYQMAEVAAYVAAVAGLTVLIGLSGQISIGNGAFMAVGAYGGALLMLHLNWPLYLVFLASAVIAAAGGAIFGLAAARLRGPYLAGATLMLAVALPSLADQYTGVFGGDQGLSTSITTPAFLGATFPPDPLAGLGDLRRRPDHPGAAGQPQPQPDRPQLARGARRRGCGLAVRPERGQAADPRVRGERRMRRTRRGAARRGHRDRGPRRLHAHPVDRAAHRGGGRRARQPARRGVGQPDPGPRAHLPHQRGGQPRPVRCGELQRADRRLRSRPDRRHARLPCGHPGRPAPPVRAGRPRRDRAAQRLAPAQAGQRTPGGSTT